MGGLKYSEALDDKRIEDSKPQGIEDPKPHKYEKGYCDSKQHTVINMNNLRTPNHINMRRDTVIVSSIQL